MSSNTGINTIPVWFGRTNSGVCSFRGIIDDIRIYNRALSFSEIQGYCSVIAGVDEVSDLSSLIKIYPNPSNGNITISFGNALSQKRFIEIFNFLGQKLYSEKNLSSGNQKEINLNVMEGIYFVKMYDGANLYTKKIIVQ